MPIAIAALMVAYVLSQFYRAFLAVLAPVLAADLGVDAQSLAEASGWWFLAFAALQLPVGWALDRVGPRRTASVLLVVAAIGAVVFAMARSAAEVNLAMALIGAGCAPVLMASYYIFARSFSPAVFGTLAGLVIGVGSLGNIAASLPLTWAVDALGWRGAMWVLAGLTAVVAALIAALVRDPARLSEGPAGSVLDLLKIRGLWPVLVMMAAAYAPAAGLRGLWVGPWRVEVFGETAGQVGWITLVMGLAMVVGNFAYGPLERVLNTRKWLVFGGNAAMVACLVALANVAGQPGAWPVVLLAGVGLFGASFPMVMAHGRAFLPAHLVGRGVSLINLFGIGAAGLMQMVTGQIHAALTPSALVVNSAPPATPYFGLFLFYAAYTALGLAVYLLSTDRKD